MDFYFDQAYLQLILTVFWIIIGAALLIINIYKKNILLSVVGVGALVTSITSYTIATIFSFWPQYFYLKFGALILSGFVIYFTLNKIMKLSQITDSKKVDSNQLNEMIEETILLENTK